MTLLLLHCSWWCNTSVVKIFLSNDYKTTLFTHRLHKLKLLSLLDFLDQTHILQSCSGEVSLLHLQCCVSLQIKYDETKPLVNFTTQWRSYLRLSMITLQSRRQLSSMMLMKTIICVRAADVGSNGGNQRFPWQSVLYSSGKVYIVQCTVITMNTAQYITAAGKWD